MQARSEKYKKQKEEQRVKSDEKDPVAAPLPKRFATRATQTDSIFVLSVPLSDLKTAVLKEERKSCKYCLVP